MPLVLIAFATQLMRCGLALTYPAPYGRFVRIRIALRLPVKTEIRRQNRRTQGRGYQSRLMAKKDEKTVLDYALIYHRFGWCVIPIPYGTKVAQIKWGKYQKKRPDEKQLRKWFASNDYNIAVIIGEASNGLTCRDFDTMAEYEKWAVSYPELAKILPTGQTFQGMHVYFEGHVKGIRYLSNGELRGSGGYCLLPPSLHPEGVIYKWINPLVKENLIAIEPEKAGFISNLTEHTEHTKQTEQTKHTETIVSKEKEKEIYVFIDKTLPQKYKQRNQKIFFLALYIRSMHWDANPKWYRWAVREWHRRALPNIRTKEFLDTWLDFMVAWNNLKYGYIEPLQIFEFSKELEPPEQLVNDHPKETKLHKLCVWCRELHKAHEVYGSIAYLGCRTIAEGLKISHETGNKYFRILCLEDYLDIVEIGKMTKAGGIATRFRYVGV